MSSLSLMRICTPHVVYWCYRYFKLVQGCANWCSKTSLVQALRTKRVLCVAPGVLRRQCREYGPLERSCGSRCKRKLPGCCCFVSHSQTSCICCVHHQTPAERETYRGEIVLEISENQLSGVLSCWRFLENLGHIWKTNSTLSAATRVVTHHHHHGGLAGRLR